VAALDVRVSGGGLGEGKRPVDLDVEPPVATRSNISVIIAWPLGRSVSRGTAEEDAAQCVVTPFVGKPRARFSFKGGA
jgi:hypothetical protein